MNLTLLAISGRLLMALGLLLMALGLRLNQRAVKRVVYPKRQIKRGPSQPEIIRLGLAILFNSVRFGLVGV